MKITQLRRSIINNEDTLLMWTYSGCDCELRVKGIVSEDEALEMLEKQDEYFHEDSQVPVQEADPMYYSEDYYD